MFVFGALLALGCGDPYAEYRTHRTVFSAPADLAEQAEDAAEEWSVMTGLDVRIDNEDPRSIPIAWAQRETMQWFPDVGQYAHGDAPMWVDPGNGAFIGCSVRIGAGQSDRIVAITVRHEIGHCLAGLEGHAAGSGCVMSSHGSMNWCDSDVAFVCDQLGC